MRKRETKEEMQARHFREESALQNQLRSKRASNERAARRRAEEARRKAAEVEERRLAEVVLGRKIIGVQFNDSGEGTYTLLLDDGFDVAFSSSGDDATCTSFSVERRAA